MRTFLVDRTNYARFVELSEGGIWPALDPWSVVNALRWPSFG
jgi:hypothetical protein